MNLDNRRVSERVRMRAVEVADAKDRVRWLNTPEVQEHLSFEWPVSMVGTEAWIRRTAVDASRRDFTFEDNDGTGFGWGGLFHIDTQVSKAELYIGIGLPEYWGRGLGAEIYQILTRFGFEELGLNRIYQYQAIENTQARQATRRLGWQEEGVLRSDRWHHGEIRDQVLISMLRSEWSQA